MADSINNSNAAALFYDFNDPRNQQYQSAASHHQRLSWPVQPTPTPTASSMALNAYKRASSPLPLSLSQTYPDTASASHPNGLMAGWQLTAQMPAISLGLDTQSYQATAFDTTYGIGFQASPQDFQHSPQEHHFPAHSFHQQPQEFQHTSQDYQQLSSEYQQVAHDFQPSTQDFINQQAELETGVGLSINTSMPVNGSYLALQNDFSNMAHIQQMPIDWSQVDQSLLTYNPIQHGLTEGLLQHALAEPAVPAGFTVGSPSEAYLSDGQLDVRSLTSSGSDNGWAAVENNQQHHHSQGAIFNPEQALHGRTFSDSSFSENGEQPPRNSWESSYVEITNALNSPSSESGPDGSVYSDQSRYFDLQQPNSPLITTATAHPIAIRGSGSPQKSPTSPTSRRRVGKAPITKPTKGNGKIVRTGSKGEEKRVGRRKGPLSADQRKQASEIRKLGACIRCRFLKKTCDKGDPCAGCQPSHARLWLVPCTRVDIKDLGYFIKGWKADYERHITMGFSVNNIKGFSDRERIVYVSHGYGHYMPITAREVYVRDEKVFNVDWTENTQAKPVELSIDTAKLSAGVDGVSQRMISDYLEHHIDGGFEEWVDEHFQGTPFITDILKIAYRFYRKEQTPVIRKALKFVLAYNLTQTVTWLEGLGSEEVVEGKVEDPISEYNGHTVAPVMINFQIKAAMAETWRELQRNILEDLSSLYSSIYSKDKLKHWPTIFMLASLLLVVWEEMQFDSHYRVPVSL